MNPLDLHDLYHAHDVDDPAPVTVIASDYRYDGWLIMLGYKRRSRALRCAVEDEYGRIFIHNASQIRKRDAV
jgi:hypothetical protein